MCSSRTASLHPLTALVIGMLKVRSPRYTDPVLKTG